MTRRFVLPKPEGHSVRTSSSTTRTRLRRASGVLGAALAVVLATALAPATATAQAATAPTAVTAAQLSVAITNGRTSVSVGDQLDYTITARNLGTTELTGLEVTQSVGRGLRFESADPVATVRSTSIRWQTNIAAGSSATFTTKMTVITPPAGTLRIASVGCVNATVGGPPVVCATDSDPLVAAGSAS